MPERTGHTRRGTRTTCRTHRRCDGRTTPTARSAPCVLAVLLLCAVACSPRHERPAASASVAASSVARGADTAGRGFTLVASGDVLPHDSIIRQARSDAAGHGYDFAPMLAGVKSVVSRADLAICHMETVYGADGDYTGYPTFKSPPEVAQGLRATGYDACSTASNHTLDDGAAGVGRTLDALDRAGVRHTGSARNAAEGTGPTWLNARGARVAHLAYAYGTNGIPVPQGRPWLVNLINPERIIADARAARRAGADVVVVSVHWGTEWQDAPDAQQLRLAQQLTAASTGSRPDVDLVLGTHAHIPQAYEKLHGTWVVYGMGDQIAGDMVNYSGEHDPRGNESTLARFTFAPPAHRGERWRVTKAEFIPQWFDTAAGRVVNLNAAIAGGRPLTAIRDRIRTVVLSRGAGQAGLVMAQ